MGEEFLLLLLMAYIQKRFFLDVKRFAHPYVLIRGEMLNIEIVLM